MSTEYPTISSVKPLMYKLLEKVLKVEDSDSSISKQMKEIKSDLGGRYVLLNSKLFWMSPLFLILATRSSCLSVTVTKTKHLNKLRRKLLICAAPAITAHKITGQMRSSNRWFWATSKEVKERWQRFYDCFALWPVVQRHHARTTCSQWEGKERALLYKAEHSAELDCDPLKWWQSGKLAYPLMSKLVQKRFPWWQPVCHQRVYSVQRVL